MSLSPRLTSGLILPIFTLSVFFTPSAQAVSPDNLSLAITDIQTEITDNQITGSFLISNQTDSWLPEYQFEISLLDSDSNLYAFHPQTTLSSLLPEDVISQSFTFQVPNLDSGDYTLELTVLDRAGFPLIQALDTFSVVSANQAISQPVLIEFTSPPSNLHQQGTVSLPVTVRNLSQQPLALKPRVSIFSASGESLRDQILDQTVEIPANDELSFSLETIEPIEQSGIYRAYVSFLDANQPSDQISNILSHNWLSGSAFPSVQQAVITDLSVADNYLDVSFLPRLVSFAQQETFSVPIKVELISQETGRIISEITSPESITVGSTPETHFDIILPLTEAPPMDSILRFSFGEEFLPTEFKFQGLGVLPNNTSLESQASQVIDQSTSNLRFVLALGIMIILIIILVVSLIWKFKVKTATALSLLVLVPPFFSGPTTFAAHSVRSTGRDTPPCAPWCSNPSPSFRVSSLYQPNSSNNRIFDFQAVPVSFLVTFDHNNYQPSDQITVDLSYHAGFSSERNSDTQIFPLGEYTFSADNSYLGSNGQFRALSINLGNQNLSLLNVGPEPSFATLLINAHHTQHGTARTFATSFQVVDTTATFAPEAGFSPSVRPHYDARTDTYLPSLTVWYRDIDSQSLSATGRIISPNGEIFTLPLFNYSRPADASTRRDPGDFNIRVSDIYDSSRAVSELGLTNLIPGVWRAELTVTDDQGNTRDFNLTREVFGVDDENYLEPSIRSIFFASTGPNRSVNIHHTVFRPRQIRISSPEVSITLPSGQVVTRTVDPASSRTRLTIPNEVGLHKVTYSFNTEPDLNGRITSSRDYYVGATLNPRPGSYSVLNLTLPNQRDCRVASIATDNPSRYSVTDPSGQTLQVRQEPSGGVYFEPTTSGIYAVSWISPISGGTPTNFNLDLNLAGTACQRGAGVTPLPSPLPSPSVLPTPTPSPLPSPSTSPSPQPLPTPVEPSPSPSPTPAPDLNPGADEDGLPDFTIVF